MAFSNFQSVSDVQKAYGIRYEKIVFIVPTELAPSEMFLAEMRFTDENIDVFSSEGSRTEFIIAPILREVYKHYSQIFSFWAQKPLTADPLLSGVPDYLFGTRSPLGRTVLEMPLVLVVEAKKNDFEQGWGQCLAELVAAQKLNQDANRPVYGIVTDGRIWEFGKLTTDLFVLDPSLYGFAAITQLFGAIDFVLQSSL